MTGSPAGSPEPEALDRALTRLHGSGRAAELSRLHEQAVALMEEDGARRFHLTHAWVFALEAGAPEAEALRARLAALGGFRTGAD